MCMGILPACVFACLVPAEAIGFPELSFSFCVITGIHIFSWVARACKMAFAMWGREVALTING